MLISSCRAIQAVASSEQDDRQVVNQLQVARTSEDIRSVEDGKEIEQNSNQHAEPRLVLEAAYAHTKTTAVFTDSAGAILREQAFLEMAVTNNTITLRLYARREWILFNLELPEETAEELPPTCWERCCTGSRDPCHACTVVRVYGTNNLRRARDWGLEIIRGLLFPLFSRFGSEVFSTAVFIIALLSVSLSLPTFIRDAMAGQLLPLEIARLTISLALLFLAVIDFAYNVRSCLVWRACFRCCCNTEGGGGKQKAGKQKRTVEGCCCKPLNVTDMNPGNLNQSEDKEQAKSGKLKHFFTKYLLDIVRVLIVEALIYPSIICDILDNAGSKTYQGTVWEQFNFARFIFTAAKTIVMVYVVRLLVIGTTVVSLEKIRRGEGFIDETDNVIQQEKKGCFSMFTEHNGKKRAGKAIVLEIFFLLHIFGQMLTQGLMLGAIWAKVEYDNPDDPSLPGGLIISPFTWTMIVLGFILPIFGTFTFFISTYVWTQEFPLDFIITMLSALKKCNPTQIGKRALDHVQKIESIVKKVETDVKDRNMNICFKIFFPFYTPHLAIISCLYDIILLSFAVFFFVGQERYHQRGYFIDSTFHNVTTVVYPNLIVDYTFEFYNYGWLLYCLIGICLVNIANLPVVAVGLWWMIIVPLTWPVLFIIICPMMCIWQAILKPIKKNCTEERPSSNNTRSYAPNR